MAQNTASVENRRANNCEQDPCLIDGPADSADAVAALDRVRIDLRDRFEALGGTPADFSEGLLLDDVQGLFHGTSP